MRDRTPVIVGIGLSDGPVAPHLDAVQHHVLALRRALEDSGVYKRDIDGYCCAGASKSDSDPDDLAPMAEYLGIEHRWLDSTMVGGSSFEFFAQHAAAAIRDGQCDAVLMTYGSDLLSRQGRMLGSKGHFRGAARVPGAMQYEVPYGNVLIGAYAMAAQRHMHEYGTTPQQLAEIAVAVREHASLNPDALYRDPITVDDVVSSRMVADPLPKPRLWGDPRGGGGVIPTPRRAAPRPPPAAGVRAGGRRRPEPLAHQRDARLHDHGGGAGGRRSLPPGGRHARRHRHRPALRQLHDHRAAVARGPRFLPQGGGRPLRGERCPAAGRQAAAEHRRRWAELHPPGHAGDLPAHRVRPPAARPGRCRPGARRRAGPRLRLGRLAVVHGHRDPRQGRPMTRGHRFHRTEPEVMGFKHETYDLALRPLKPIPSGPSPVPGAP